MTAFAVIVAAGGARQVLDAAPMALVYALAVIGGSFILSLAFSALMTRLARRQQPEPAAEVGDDVIAEFGHSAELDRLTDKLLADIKAMHRD